jgi:vacuolar protein sorting-associated protein 26
MAQAFLSSFVGGSPAKITIKFADADLRPTVPVKQGEKTTDQFLFRAGDDVQGTVDIEVAGSKRLDHLGIKIELIGQIELLYDRSSIFEFTSLVRELDAPGELHSQKQYSFAFTEVEKQYESYDGINVRLRYFLRVTISRNYNGKIAHEETFRVQVDGEKPENNPPIKMEVGIEDCLHIEFEYNKTKYHLKDVVHGKIFFLLVRIKIKNMEVAIIRRESTGSGANVYNESETVAKFEIMDGAPVRGESIPIRLFLGGFENLTPTFKNVNNKFSVKYFLNLVLVDEEDRRYFKQQEVSLWRKSTPPTKAEQ